MLLASALPVTLPYPLQVEPVGDLAKWSEFPANLLNPDHDKAFCLESKQQPDRLTRATKNHPDGENRLFYSQPRASSAPLLSPESNRRLCCLPRNPETTSRGPTPSQTFDVPLQLAPNHTQDYAELCEQSDFGGPPYQRQAFQPVFAPLSLRGNMLFARLQRHPHDNDPK